MDDEGREREGVCNNNTTQQEATNAQFLLTHHPSLRSILGPIRLTQRQVDARNQQLGPGCKQEVFSGGGNEGRRVGATAHARDRGYSANVCYGVAGTLDEKIVA